MEIPAVSVIIPLYNVEKYVAECLDSILAQTFQNFEVIVVDDCSTDSSVAIVESLAKNFGGRLKLAKMKTNSGGAGFPRNKGIELSRGEYLAFVDPDDTITPTALEELYTLAKNFNADVVHCEKHFKATHAEWRDFARRAGLKPYNYLTKEHRVLTHPAIFDDDIENRIREFAKRWILWSVCLQLVRRDFIIENGLRFENIYSEDMIFTMCEICCAARYVLVPNVTYYYLTREDSTTNEDSITNDKQTPPAQKIKKYVRALIVGFKYLENFFCANNLFAQRADLKYVLFDFFAQAMFGRFTKIYENIPIHQFDEFFRKEFPADDNVALSAYTINLAMLYRFRLTQNQKYIRVAQNRIEQLEDELRQLKSRE